MPQTSSGVARRRSPKTARPPRDGKPASTSARTPGASASGRWWALGSAGFVLFILFAVLAYALNWQWTGFPGNTLWDWLQLLLVPLALNAATIWYSGGRRLPLGERRLFRIGISFALALVVIVVVAAAYRLRWAWTGFLGQPAPAVSSAQPKTLWDWLNMLLLPAAVAIATIQFSRRRQQTTERAAT
jgi:hypothetical protein